MSAERKSTLVSERVWQAGILWQAGLLATESLLTTASARLSNRGGTDWRRTHMDVDVQGSCLCGAISYQVSTPLKAATHCHCKKCQKSHGAAFATYASAPQSAVTINASPNALRRYESSKGVTRQFCSQCGSSLFWSDANGLYPQWLSIALGTLDTPFVAHKQTQSCLESKAGWFSGRSL